MVVWQRDGGQVEIESADDFILSNQTLISSATFTGLLSGASTANVGNVVVEIYRVFPADSDVGRTSGPPTFSTPQVPTRVNSPADVELDSRSFIQSNLTVSTMVLNSNFTAANSVLNGINAKPNNLTLGEGSVTGQEVKFTVNFTTPFNLPAGHYFFVPQVQTFSGEFFWLSAPSSQFPGDLQAWIRNEKLAPDWLRIGTDIVGGTTFDMAFSLNGESVVPLPAALPLFATGLGALGLLGWRRKRKSAAATSAA